MPFYMGLTQANPPLDTLPVALVKNYPLEKRDYKPYTQGRFCFAQGEFLCRLLAFEVNPFPKSQMRFVLCPTETSLPLVLDGYADGSYNGTVGDEEVKEGIVAHFYTGEDLQGIYWGVDFRVKETIFQHYYPDFVPQNGAEVYGNLFKISTHSPKEHYGSFFPVDFQGNKPYQTYGKFEIINY